MVREFEGLRKSESALPDQILVLVAAMVEEWRVGWEKELKRMGEALIAAQFGVSTQASEMEKKKKW